METAVLVAEDFSSGDAAILESGGVTAETQVVDYEALMNDAMKFSFIVCGVALMISLGVAAIIKLFKL